MDHAILKAEGMIVEMLSIASNSCFQTQVRFALISLGCPSNIVPEKPKIHTATAKKASMVLLKVLTVLRFMSARA